MTARNDLGRMLGAWFGAEAAPAPPTEPLVRILETTRRRRPRPSLLAGIGSHWVDGSATTGMRGGMAALRPVAVTVLVALLAVALLVGALLAGSRLRVPKPLPIPHTYVGEFVAEADLPTPMAPPVLVQLLDGRVLVIGNGGGRSLTTTAVLYDVGTGASISAGPIASADALGASAAVLLRDGRVLLVGDKHGFDGRSLAFGQLFDPRTMQFEPTGQMAVPRWSADLALLPDGRVLVTGETVNPSSTRATAELFDPATATFSAVGSVGLWTVSSMATLPDGRVFFVGDEVMTDEEASWVVSTAIFDPRTGAFGAAGTVPFGAAPGRTLPMGVQLTAVALPDGRVALLGGTSLGMKSSVAVWDPTSQTLSPRWGGPEWVFGSTLLADGRILMTGDRERAIWAGIYDPTTLAVSEIRPTAAWRPSSIRLADGRVLLVGGLADGQLHENRSAPAVGTVQIFH